MVFLGFTWPKTKSSQSLKILKRHQTLKCHQTLKVHKVLRTCNEDNVCKMEFYELAGEKDPFHIQWYRKEGDPEVCGLNQLPLSYEIDQTCGCCKERYKGYEEWLKCKLCDHEAYMKLILKSNQHLLRSFSLFCSKVFIFI